MGLYKAQFISMIIMITLGIGVFTGFNIEWYSLKTDTDRFFNETNFADYRIITEDGKGFSAEEMQKIREIQGVKAASRYLTVDCDVYGQNGKAISVNVCESGNVSTFLTVSSDSEPYDENSEDGIWINYQYAQKQNLKKGDKLTFVYKSFPFTGYIKGFIKASEHMVCIRDESQIMPDFSLYGYCYISPAAYKKFIKGLNFYPQINVVSNLEKEEFSKKVEDALGKTTLVLTKSENYSYAGAQSEIEEGQTMSSVIPVLFLIIASLTMITTMHRIAAKEKTQIGTLKALGFKDSRIILHYASYAFAVGLLGIILGSVSGFGIAKFLMSGTGAMGSYFDMPYWNLYMPNFCYFILIGILVAFTLIGFLSVKQMLKGTAADALRPYAPKKVKNLLIEKTKLWNKFSFGTKWNMRDVLRHKSRALMSLIGVVGCVLIIIAALGMNDSMNSFLQDYYRDGMNYNTRIYLSDESDDYEINEIRSQYDGDASASVAVELNGKAISLDIYDLKKDMVRFPLKNGGYAKLSNDSAYICTRIADEFKLKAGDEITVSPYGTDKKYNLKIAGIIRSVVENAVITVNYADSLNIDYKLTNVYTNVKSDLINKNAIISNVQSKSDLMASFDSFMGMMYASITLLIVAGMVLGFIVLYNLGVMSYTERYREMATLKVVGFKDKKIGSLLISQSLWVTLIGTIIGLPLGYATLSYLFTQLASEYEMQAKVSALSVLISAALAFLVTLAVSFALAKKNKKINMVESLKCAE